MKPKYKLGGIIEIETNKLELSLFLLKRFFVGMNVPAPSFV
jgi:hypothetical protein